MRSFLTKVPVLTPFLVTVVVTWMSNKYSGVVGHACQTVCTPTSRMLFSYRQHVTAPTVNDSYPDAFSLRFAQSAPDRNGKFSSHKTEIDAPPLILPMSSVRSLLVLTAANPGTSSDTSTG